MTGGGTTRGPAGLVARLAGLALLVAAGAACGHDAPATGGAPAPPSAHPAAAAAAAVLAAVDTNDATRFAALCADRKDPEGKPTRTDDVRATAQDLHERYGLRARTVAAPTGVSPTECDVEVALDGGGATLVLTLRRAADGAWRVVGFAEATAPASAADGPPTDGPAPGK